MIFLRYFFFCKNAVFQAAHYVEKEAKTFLFLFRLSSARKQNYAKSQMQRRKFNSQGLRKRDKNIFVKARIHFSARFIQWLHLHYRTGVVESFSFGFQ